MHLYEATGALPPGAPMAPSTKVKKEAALAAEKKEVLNPFYCALCDKQYANVKEMENHLSSYDHHHRKRAADLSVGKARG